MNYSVERLSVSNLRHLQTLYKAVFRRQVSYEHLFRKYNTKFAGAEFIGYLAIAPDHSPAAFYGVLPCHFRQNQRVVVAAQSADTMTHPDHRRAGLFRMLAQKTYALARENGIEFIFGFPNQNSLPGFVKLNWNFLPPMKLFMIPASPVPFFRILAKIPFLLKGYIRFLKILYQPKTSQISFQHNHSDGVVRDRAFLNYKTYSDSFIIEIENMLVWIKLDGLLKVGFADIDEPRSISPLLKKIKRIAMVSGCHHVVFITSENTSLHRALVSHVTPKESFPVGILPLSDRDIDFSNARFYYCDIDIF